MINPSLETYIFFLLFNIVYFFIISVIIYVSARLFRIMNSGLRVLPIVILIIIDYLITKRAIMNFDALPVIDGTEEYFRFFNPVFELLFRKLNSDYLPLIFILKAIQLILVDFCTFYSLKKSKNGAQILS